MVSLLIRILVNDYNRINDDKVRQGYGVVCSGVSIMLNILLCCLKFFAGMISGSIAVVADAVNNLSDAGSSIINIIEFKMAGRRLDLENTEENGRIEYVASLIISIIIIVLGVEMGKSSVSRIIDTVDPVTSRAVFIIMEAAIVVKIYMYVYNKRVGDRVGLTKLKTAAIDNFTDAIATTAALLAVIIYEFTGMVVDGWCGLIVSVFIIYSGISSVRSSIDPLLGSEPDPEYVKLIEKYVLAQRDILGMHDLVVRDHGLGRKVISLHAEVPDNGNLIVLHDSIDNIERKLKEVLKCDCIIHMDPVVTDGSITSRMRDFVRIIATNVDPRLEVKNFKMVQGPTHTNLIFTLVIPDGFRMSDQETVSLIKQKVRDLPGDHYAYISIENPHT